MKAAQNNRSRFFKILFFTFVLLFAMNSTFAANPGNKVKAPLMDRMSSNLAVGIKSNNDGLRTSAIYMAGYYEIKSLVKDLVEQLKVEKNAKTRILISLALYRIGDKEGIDAVSKFTAGDKDKEVRRIGIAVKNQFLADSNSNLIANEK